MATFDPLDMNNYKVEKLPKMQKSSFEKWMARTKWRDIVIWYDRRTETYNLKDMGAAKIKYIHELQHALKLAGIEKDIEL